jgi:hypothetical protein
LNAFDFALGGKLARDFVPCGQEPGPCPLFLLDKRRIETKMKRMLMASLGTQFSKGISIFRRKNELIFLTKMKIYWKMVLPN